MWATELNDLYVSYTQNPKSNATSAVNQGPPLALQVGMDSWKACNVPFPYVALFFSHWVFLHRGF